MGFWVVIPAAGIGARMQADRPKQYLQVAGKSILEHTLQVFLGYPGLRGIVLSLAVHDEWWPQSELCGHPAIRVVEGGKERADSVLNALRALQASGAGAQDWVLVHDAARPLLSRRDLGELLRLLKDDEVGGLLAVPARDTLKRTDADRRVAATLPRQEVWHALTPQMFRLETLSQALELALQQAVAVTDEASAMEHAGHAPRLVQGSSLNFKITTPEDLQLFTLLCEK